MISWLPPRRPNGVLTRYIVYIRMFDQGHEKKITPNSVPAQNLHYDAMGLKNRETYEAWVTAWTKVGEGSKSSVIKLQPSPSGEYPHSSNLGNRNFDTFLRSVPAAIISFGVMVLVPWRVDVNLACLFVGNPRPSAEWRLGDVKLQKQQR